MVSKIAAISFVLFIIIGSATDEFRDYGFGAVRGISYWLMIVASGGILYTLLFN